MLIDGKALAQRVREETAREAAALPRKAGLAVVLVGDDPASRIYVSGKERDCEQCGFMSREYKFDDTVTQETLLELISALNRDAEIDGILVQLPLPEHIDEARCCTACHHEDFFSYRADGGRTGRLGAVIALRPA